MNLFSVPISITSKSQALAIVNEWLRERKLLIINHQPLTIKFITTPNPEMIVAAQSDPEFLKALQSADLAIPDGIGIVWAISLRNFCQRIQFRKLHRVLKQKQLVITHLSGLDFMEALIGESAKNGWKVMLLGGKPGVGEKAVENLKRTVLSGRGPSSIKSISGPPDIDKVIPVQLNNLINSINSFSPDLLFVAFGHGKQEKWLNANRKRLNVGVAMGVGGAFDQIADPSLRPPYIINSIGLGWLYRLFREPWRWRRQLSLIKFIWMVFIKALKHT